MKKLEEPPVTARGSDREPLDYDEKDNESPRRNKQDEDDEDE